MRMKRQQGGADQGDLFDEALRAAQRHDANREGNTGPAANEEPQARAAWDQERALTQHLMEAVSSAANLNRAYKRVKGNGGAPGVDGTTVEALRGWIAANREHLIASLLDGSHQPHPVRGVSIPKPGAGNANSASPLSWTVWCSKRSRKSWSRSLTRCSRGQASVSDLAAAHTTRCARPGSTWQTATRSLWTSIWKNSWMAHQTTPRFLVRPRRGRL
jgi:hypothetical protein